MHSCAELCREVTVSQKNLLLLAKIVDVGGGERVV